MIVDCTTRVVDGAIVLNVIVVGDGAGIYDVVLVYDGAIINYGIGVRDAAVVEAIVGDGTGVVDGAGVVDGSTWRVDDSARVVDGNCVVKDTRIDDLTVVGDGAGINQSNATNCYRIYGINC